MLADADFIDDSESMGPIIGIWWLQYRSTRMFCTVLCPMANYDGQAQEIRYIVSSSIFFHLVGLCDSVLRYPRGKMACCRSLLGM